MKLFSGNKNDGATPVNKRHIIVLAVFVAGLLLVVFAARGIWLGQRDAAAAQAEYTQLRDMGAGILTAMTQKPSLQERGQATQETENAAAGLGNTGSAAAYGGTAQAADAAYGGTAQGPRVAQGAEGTAQTAGAASGADTAHAAGRVGSAAHEYATDPAVTPSTVDVMALLSALAEMNPDFAGWMAIPGTTISYPVVRGPDNTRYLNTTFRGARNPAGAIFMESACDKGFDAPVCIVYGHNMRDGSMFGSLSAYMNKGYLEENPEIVILTADGRSLTYRIFNAKRTDVWDSAYSLDPNDAAAPIKYPAAAGSTQLLILSTCIDGENRQARLLVFAALDMG